LSPSISRGLVEVSALLFSALLFSALLFSAGDVHSRLDLSEGSLSRCGFHAISMNVLDLHEARELPLRLMIECAPLATPHG
jgi:hypothetical protein